MPVRNIIDPGLGIPALRPVASPVDVFQVPKTDSLTRLGQALGQIDPSVQRFTGALTDKLDDSAQNEGRLAAEKLRQEGLTLADATRKGLIPASHNPFFMAGLREQIGRNMADKYDGDLRAAIGNDTNLQSSTNIADFDAFTKKFRDQWSQQNIGDTDQDNHFKTGFQFRAGAVEDQVRNTFANGIEAKAVQQADDATFSEVYKHFTDNAQTMTPQQIASDINTLTDDLITKQGRNPTRTLQAAAHAVAAAAVNTRSLQGLDVLKNLQAKNGPSAEAMKLYASARDKVTTDLWTQNEHDVTAAKQQRAQIIDDTMAEAVKMRMADPHADLRPLLGKLAFDPHAAEQLSQLDQATNSLNFNSDQRVKEKLFGDIWSGGDVTRTSIVRQINAGNLNYVDGAALMEQLNRRDEVNRANADNETKKAFQDFQFQNALTELKGRFAKDGILSAEDADRAAHAQATLIDQWLGVYKSFGDPSKMADKEKWLTGQADAITKYERSGSTYTSQGVQPVPNAVFDKNGVPTPMDQRFPKKLVLSPQDLQAMSTTHVLPASAAAIMRQYNVLESEQADFIREQVQFLRKKNTPNK